MTNAFKQQTQAYRQGVDQTLDAWLCTGANTVALALVDAMRYSVFNGGKRVRPILVYAAAEAVKPGYGTSATVNCAAAAVECIHAYSLIHDDLPAMDDDDLRRGKPTCHIQFDEATAILAGDALQTLAFEHIAELDDAHIAINLIRELGTASGASGMVGGQMLDLQAEGQSDELALSELERVHRHKTGALIRASVRMGAIAAGANDDQLQALTEYAEAIGLAFQVQDDIIDVCSDTETLGKQQGADIALGKSTYVSLLGLCAAQEKAELLVTQARQALGRTPINGELLASIADYIIDRRN